MRLYIASTAEELEPHRCVAEALARELGFRVLGGEPADSGPDAVVVRARRVATADTVLAIVGHRRGEAPPPELGGDGFHPWAWWAVRSGFDRGLDIRVLMAADGCSRVPPESDPTARAVMRDFRAELARLAVFFDGDDLEDFRLRLREALSAARDEPHPAASRPATVEAGLRRWPPAPLPPSPYPVLLPYSHSALLAGRDRELRELRRLLARPVPILGLHAASGTGKSSILGAGLVPGLRAEGRPVAFERYPSEPGLVARLLGDLLVSPIAMDDDDARGFVDRMRGLRDLSGSPPILILDQLEDLFRGRQPDAAATGDGVRRSRQVVARLLAASVQRQAGLGEPPCRWLLAYRQEFHGRIFQWLGDLSGDLSDELPYDLTGVDRFQAWALPPLGTPPSGTAALGTEARKEAAARIFRAVIEKPLGLRGDDGRLVYPYRFEPGGIERLARLFGEARATRRNAPLATELQVVLAHLLQGAERAAVGIVREVRVPEEPSAILDHALEDHLKRSLDFAFPTRKSARADPESRRRRTRALLALRELAGLHGQPEEGRPVGVLARAIGEDGYDVLDRLSTARTRIVFLQTSGTEAGDSAQAGEPVYRLVHDRMAEVIVRQVDDEGTYAGLGIDADLLALRRFVALQRQHFSSGEVEQATAIPTAHFRAITHHADCLLWDEQGHSWWRACQLRRKRERSRSVRLLWAAGVLVAVLLSAVGLWASRTIEIRELLATVERGDPAAAFAALDRLGRESGLDRDRLLDRLARRERPFDVLERGLGGVEAAARGPAVLRVAQLLLLLQRERTPEDPRWIASIVWALDFFARPEPALGRRAEALRDEILRPLRAAHPPPPTPERDDPAWSELPAGTFQMGLDPGDAPDGDPFEESPAHTVTISAFRIMTHEVTFGEYRRLVPDSPFREPPAWPAGYISWYDAYTYAAWLGGRLPTEAEWEYAARAGCQYASCKADGSEAELGEVAWWTGNSVDARTREPSRKPVGLLEANPWGLYDIYGNVHEWTADWAGPYAGTAETNPAGPPSAPGQLRIFRGGCALYSPTPIGASRRGAHGPGAKIPQIGFRVVLPLE